MRSSRIRPIFSKKVFNFLDWYSPCPYQLSATSTQAVTPQNLIIIDKLDECNNSQTQITLDAISLNTTPPKLSSSSQPSYRHLTKSLKSVDVLFHKPTKALATMANGQEDVQSALKRLSGGRGVVTMLMNHV
jgi:hypothetical protein